MLKSQARNFTRFVHGRRCQVAVGRAWFSQASSGATIRAKVEAIVLQPHLRFHSTDRRRATTDHRMHLVFDFDGTITQKDTIGVLVDSALSLQKERGQDLAARWDHVIKAYTDDAKALKESFRPAESDRTSLDEERKFLAAQYEVDEASLSRVSASGIFAGIEKEQYFQFGKNAVQNGQILIRAGFRELVNFAATQGWSVHVISINWSSDFIAGALHPFDANLIIANDLSIDGTIQGPEVIQRKLTSPWDKLDAFKIVTATSKAKVVYFGDSVNDVECLIRGGVAIADSQDTSLLKMLRRVGMQTPRLSIQTTQSSLTWASDFWEFMKANSLEPPPSLETRQ